MENFSSRARFLRIRGKTFMSRIIKSVGNGLFGAGFLLTIVYFWGLRLKGSDALRDALNPLSLSNYLALAPLLPGACLLWLANHIPPRRHHNNG